MTVAKLIEKLESIQQTWKTSVVPRGHGEESQLKSHLGNSVSYSTVAASFETWIASLKKLADKPKVSKQISKPLLESTDIALSTISAALIHVGNGVEWMCANRSFCSGYTIAGALVREICSEHGRETESIASAANERLSKDINSIQVAVTQSEAFVSNWKSLEEKIEKIEEAEANLEATLKGLESSTTSTKEKISSFQNEVSGSAEESTEEIATALASFKETLDAALTSLTEAQKLHTEAQKIRGETQSTAAKAKQDLDSSTSALEQAIQKNEKIKGRLTEALKNVQMEGLAGSFTRMKDDTNRSRAAPFPNCTSLFSRCFYLCSCP
jgi:exonuclease VII small subunit